MKEFGRKRELVERPKDEPKFDKNNELDRRIVLTLVLVGLAALVLAIGAIILWNVLTSQGTI